MPVVSIGDMSRHFLSLHNGGRIKTDLARLGQELSSGKTHDIVARLGGQTQPLSGIAHSLKTLSAYHAGVNETAMMLDTMQMSLDRFDDQRSRATDGLLTVTQQSQPKAIAQAGATALQAFEDMVGSLNKRLAGRSVFAGTALDQNPLASSDDILSALRADIAGATTASSVETIVAAWFNDPSGGFATLGYQGDTGDPTHRVIGSDHAITIDARADNAEIKFALEAVVLGALAAEMTGVLSQSDQAALMRTAGEKALSAAQGVARVQGGLGMLQEATQNGAAQISAEKTALEIAHNELTSADPFETAARLQSVQLQLETHFAVTARLSRLSLAEYI